MVRFKVRPAVWLLLELTVPIHADDVFTRLTFTRNVEEGGYWLGPLRRSLHRLDVENGRFLTEMLSEQSDRRQIYDIDHEQYERALKRRIQRPEGSVVVSVPDDASESTAQSAPVPNERESILVQADLCRIGEAMGFRIWLPAADRTRVTEYWSGAPGVLLERLPLNYDETTVETIKRIDVLWLKGRSITRAFEVEHTTAIYSGILRMADLCALLPNVNVSLHIVAPEERREKVFQEISRPVFSLLEHTPLAQRCTYLSYGSVREIVDLPHLSHTTDTVLDEFVEYAE